MDPRLPLSLLVRTNDVTQTRVVATLPACEHSSQIPWAPQLSRLASDSHPSGFQVRNLGCNCLGAKGIDGKK